LLLVIRPARPSLAEVQLADLSFEVELREPDGQDAHPDADMVAIRRLCQNWRLSGLDPLIEEAAGGS
jgi:hypothetical protein